MSEKLTLREKLHIGEKRPDGEKPRMSKKLKKGIIAAACVVGVCGAVWGGLTIARNAQRGDVNVYAVNECAMTDYWGDTSNTSGMVTTDKLQKIYISQSQTVKKVWVKEGDSVKKGTALVSYDSTLTQATVERAKIDYDRQTENLEVMKNELELLKKAKNKETLQAELTGYQKQRDDIIKKIYNDEGLDKTITSTHVLPSTDPNTVSNGTEKAPYYYQWISKIPLTQEDLIDMFTKNGKLGDDPLFVVLVYRTDDKVGGLVERCWGLKLTAVTKTEGADPEPGTTTTDPNAPSTSAAKKTIASVSMEPADLAPYQDKSLDYGDKKEEISKLDKKIAQIQELLDTSMTQLDLNKAILEKAQAVKEQEVNLKVAKLKLDKKLAELGDGNRNVSYYPFKVFVTEDANLQPNDYVDIQYQKDTSAEESGSSLYLQSMFIRTDNGKSYVMARGEDGRLEQRWVQTGRDLWGSYTQIRGGLTIDDYVAFPYGRDVVEGAHTQEATTDQLYNYGI